MFTAWHSYICKHIVGLDPRGGGIGCGKPRCEEAGRRCLCLQHWQELERERAARKSRHRVEAQPNGRIP